MKYFFVLDLCHFEYFSAEDKQALRPEFIFFDNDSKASFVVEGVSFDFSEKEKLVNDSTWKSPEMLEFSPSEAPNSRRQPKSDIFTVGLIALYCLDSDEFLKNKDDLNKNEKFLESYLDEFHLRFESPRFFKVIRSMLSYSPSKRPDIVQLSVEFPDFFMKEFSPQIELPAKLNKTCSRPFSKVFFGQILITAILAFTLAISFRTGEDPRRLSENSYEVKG